MAKAQSVESLVGALPESPDDLAAVIGFANAALPDSDPRKITRKHVELLRETVAPLRAFADALESYLPPPAAAPAPESCRECRVEGVTLTDGFRSRSCAMAYHDRDGA